jgi:uncharacterized protein YaiE (UPF0345 family)
MLDGATNDISFYDSTGTTQGFFWDASTQRLGLGDTSPGETLSAVGNIEASNTSSNVRLMATASGVANAYFGFNNSGSTQNGIPNNSAYVTVPQSYPISFGTANQNRMTITSDGSVGIGTASPSSPAGFSKSVTLYDASSASMVVNAGGSYRSEFAVSSSGGWVGTYDAIPLRFVTGNSEAARIDSSQNFLVGKTSASVVNDGIQLEASGTLGVTRTNDDVAIFNRKSNDGNILVLRKDNTTVGSVGSYGGVYANIGTGNVGLMFNTGASAVIPHNMTTNAPRGSGIDLGQSGYKWKNAYFSGTVYADQFLGQNDTNTGIAVGGNDVLQLSTAGSEKARVDASGNVGIGTSSPSDKLHVEGDIRVNNAIESASNLNLEAENGALRFYTGSGSPSEVARFDSSGNLLVGYTSSNGAYKLQVNSQIFATSATIATSDGNYKENITPLDGALSLVSQLNPVQFDWKEHPVHEFDRNQPTIGFIAQEVQQVLAEQPYLNSIVKSNECVLEPEETDDEGNVIKEAVTEPFLGIAEGNMVALLTAAIKEQQATITELEARIAALEAK